MGERSKITVGIPTYNRPEGLKKTLECLKNQSHKNLKIVISDNCSDRPDKYIEIINEFKTQMQLEYIRQNNNIGAILNMKFLLDRADTHYFLWVTDDDEFDPDFIKEMYIGMEANSNCVISLTGYDATDNYAHGYTEKNFTPYLMELPDEDTFSRMLKYASQPDYHGKARILWGLCQTQVLKECYADTLKPVSHKTDLTFAELPIEFCMLSRGNLYIANRCLLHVMLLPSSLGLKEGKMFAKREAEMCKRSFDAYRRVVNDSTLSQKQKNKINAILKARELKALVMVRTYYFIQRLSPGIAPILKKVWFALKT